MEHLGKAHGEDKNPNADGGRLSNKLASAVVIYTLKKSKEWMV